LRVEDISVGPSRTDSRFDPCSALGAASGVACPGRVWIEPAIGVAASKENGQKTSFGAFLLVLAAGVLFVAVVISKPVDVHDVSVI